MAVIMKKSINFVLIKIEILLFFFVSVSIGYAEVDRNYDIKGWGKDPFVSYFNIKEIKEKMKKEKIQKFDEGKREGLDRKEIEAKLKEILLTGILKGEENLAIMDGEIYAEGEYIKDSKIIEIGDDYVKLFKSGYEFQLNLEEQSLQTKMKSEEQHEEEYKSGESAAQTKEDNTTKESDSISK